MAIVIDRKLKTIEVYDPHGLLGEASSRGVDGSSRDRVTQDGSIIGKGSVLEGGDYSAKLRGVQEIHNVPECANFSFLYILSGILAPKSNSHRDPDRFEFSR